VKKPPHYFLEVIIGPTADLRSGAAGRAFGVKSFVFLFVGYDPSLGFKFSSSSDQSVQSNIKSHGRCNDSWLHSRPQI